MVAPQRISIGLRVSPELLAAIDSQRGDLPREAWLRGLLERHVAHELIAPGLPWKMLRNQPLREVAELIAARRGRTIDASELGDVYETVLGYIDTALGSDAHSVTERLSMRRDRAWLEGIAIDYATHDPEDPHTNFSHAFYLTAPLQCYDRWYRPSFQPPISTGAIAEGAEIPASPDGFPPSQND